MKKFIFILLLFSTIYSVEGSIIRYKNDSINSSQLESPKRIEYTENNSIIVDFNFSSCNISPTEINGDLYTIPRIKGFGLTGKIGAPALPYYRDYLPLSDTTNIAIELISSSYQDFSEYLLYPIQKPQTDSSISSYFYKDSTIYSYNTFLPNNIIEQEGYQISKGIPILRIGIYPIQYNPVTRTIRCYNRIKYKITLSQENFSSKEFNNYKNIESQKSNISLIRKVTQPSKTPNLLIVSIDKYLSAIVPYIQWKKTIGIDYQIVSKQSWKDSNEVKDSIHTIFHRSKFDYLLIVGDHIDVPGEFTTRNFSFDGSLVRFYTDLYYACMDGENDYTADVGRGRIPVKTLTEAQSVFDKLKKYQLMPSLNYSDYKGLMCGYFQTDNGNRESRRFILTNEEIGNYLMSQIYGVRKVYCTEPYNTPLFYNSGQYANNPIFPEYLKKPNYAWDGDKYDISKIINEGCYYVFYRGHGHYTKWAAPSFDNYDLSLLQNTVLPIFFSISCQTGMFSENCFAENLLKKVNGGAAGIFAASENSYSGWNDALAIGIVDAIWPKPGLLPNFGSGGISNPTTNEHSEIHRLGDALNYGLLRMSQLWNDNYNINQYTNEIFHYFGDPTMEIYSKRPSLFEEVQVSQFGNCMNVRTGVENCRITVCSKADNGKSYYKVIENCSYGYFTDVGVPCEISVTRPNFVPYFFNEDVHISNNRIYEKCAVVGKNIFITDLSISESGDMTIDATGDVIIQGNFECEKMGALQIY